MNKPARARAAEAAPSEMSLNEMLGPEGEEESAPEAKEYPMIESEMQSALEEMGYTVIPPGGAPSEEVPPA